MDEKGDFLLGFFHELTGIGSWSLPVAVKPPPLATRRSVSIFFNVGIIGPDVCVILDKQV
jgi:hypothetical protein